VAVKIQYPGAGPALMADLNQLARFARLFAALFPGMDVKPLIAELKARVIEELDYGLEADAQRAFAAAYADDPQISVPRVVASAPKVIVSEWVEGVPLSRIIASGSREERDRAGILLAVLHFSGPERAHLLHADPHPGNFRLLPDGRLGVIDFGATARLPDGHPEPIGRLLRWTLEDRADDVLADLRAEGFVRPGVEVDARGVLDYLRPLLAPVESSSFHFTRAWMQEQAVRIGDPRNEASKLGRQLNLPPAYLLIHRVTIGSIGVLCQLDTEGNFRAVLEEWLPGFTAPAR
jgi:predicted unusual protein kinase regulating ubiquinone biosynthesis (AarF/ABC1/UbiB family)